MKKNQAFVALGGMILLSVGYYSGVYFTGEAFDKELVKLEKDSNDFLAQRGIDDVHVSFELDDSNFHFRHFNVVLTSKDETKKLVFPMSATIGFLSSNIEANKIDDNTHALIQEMLDASNTDIDLSKAEVETKFHVSALPKEVEFASRIAHNNGIKDFHLGLKGSLDEKDNGTFDFIIKNYKDKNLSLEEAQISQNTHKIQKGSSLGDMSFMAKSIESEGTGSEFYANNLVFKITSSEIAKDGTFVINMDLIADSINNNKNIKSNIDVTGFDLSIVEKLKKLQNYNSISVQDNEIDALVRELTQKLVKFDINKLSLDADLALFTSDNKEFTESLKSKFNYKEDTIPLNAVGFASFRLTPFFFLDRDTNVDIHIDTSKEAAPILNKIVGEQAFKEDNNKYKTNIVFKNGKLQTK